MSEPVWVPVGSVKGPQGVPGLTIEGIPFSMQGSLRVADSVGKYPIHVGHPDMVYRVLSVTAAVEDAPLGSPVVVDVRVNGESIYADPDQRPTIAPGETLAVGGEFTDLELETGDYLNCDVVQVGSLSPGTFLTVVIRLYRTRRDTT